MSHNNENSTYSFKKTLSGTVVRHSSPENMAPKKDVVEKKVEEAPKLGPQNVGVIFVFENRKKERFQVWYGPGVERGFGLGTFF